MGPPTRISQEGFDALVSENMEDLGMEPQEALQDAIDTLKLQGVDLSGIMTSLAGERDGKQNPVIELFGALKDLGIKPLQLVPRDVELKSVCVRSMDVDVERMAELLESLYGLCCGEGSSNVSIAARNGGVELLTSICSLEFHDEKKPLVVTLKTLATIIHDTESTDIFHKIGGPHIVMAFLRKQNQDISILDSGFAVVAASSAGNEVVKESFMELKIDALLVECVKKIHGSEIPNAFDAIRVLLTSDDNRVVASQVFGYARTFAKIGMAEALLSTLQIGIHSSSLVSICSALKAVAVNEEICVKVAENGGIDIVLKGITTSCDQNNKAAAKSLCSLLTTLAASDTIKNMIVEKKGLDKLIQLSLKFSDDPAIIQEIMSIIWILSLRSPNNAARAMEAGVGDFAMEAMQRFPAANMLQKQACLMIRNLVVRNPENKVIFLNIGIEKAIRKAKQNHRNCKDAASDALRDLGFDDYRS